MYIAMQDWTNQEKWVFDQLISGYEADLDRFSPDDECNDSSKVPQYPKSQILRANFLETIINYEQFNKQIKSNNIIIKNAEVQNNFNLINSRINLLIIFEKCHFGGHVYLNRMKIENLLSFSECNFSYSLDLDSIVSQSDIFIKTCAIKELRLTTARINGSLILDGSTVYDLIEASSLNIGNTLFLKGGDYAVTILRGSHIGGNLEIFDSVFRSYVDLTSVKIGRDIHIRDRSIFHGDVDLTGAVIEGQIDLTYSIFYKVLRFSSTNIGSNILVKGISESVEKGDSLLSDPTLRTYIMSIEIIGCQVGGAVEFNNCIFYTMFTIDSTIINTDLSILYSNFKRCTTRIIASQVGISLKLSSNKFKSIDLSGTRVGQDLDLGRSTRFAMDSPPIWSSDSKFVLKNTKVGSIQDLTNSWPDMVYLLGFEYDNLGGYTSVDEDKFVHRGETWIKNWLGERYGVRDRPETIENLFANEQVYLFKSSEYSSQPYIQLSKVLRKQGYVDYANEILFLAKYKELLYTKNYSKKLWLFLQYIFVGFGYRYKWTVYWFFGLIFLGTIFALIASNTSVSIPIHIKILDSLFYSIDKTTPYLELNTQIDSMPNILKYYYYLQRILGLVLSLFLIAALTGITKRFDDRP